VAVVVAALTVRSALGVVVNGGGAANAVAPADDPGWANVGQVNGASGVYLGQLDVPGHGAGFWVVTASHVGAGSLTLNGTSYSTVPGSAFLLQNADSSSADLELFQISSDPGLPNLTLAASSPPTGSSLTMVGYGYTGAASTTSWNINAPGFPSDTPAWTWAETDSPSGINAQGVKYSTRGTKQWGQNTVTIAPEQMNDGYGTTTVFGTSATPTLGSSALAPGDSGGATFVKIGGQWELAGINLAVGVFSGQPGSTTVFEVVNGSTTYAGTPSYMGDLATYYSEIYSPIPEPTTGALFLLGAVSLCLRRR
jgi:hypothetical protein